MGFKADTSFLKFLSMGALGVHQTITQLEELGFQPIELERYCGSNKIWTTKVKRLRLPDLMCVKTGLRLEVRAKSDLKIRMSDAPNNPDRRWDAGLQDEDLAAFIAIIDTDKGPLPADEAVFFTIAELRRSEHASKLGAPKSASEGAERDRTWAATVPTRSGQVLDVTSTKIVVEQFATYDKPARRQTYSLKEKSAYYEVGDKFNAKSCFLSGIPLSQAYLSDYLDKEYDPFAELQSSSDVDRYAAVKSFPYRNDDRKKATNALEELLRRETEGRVKLEAAGSATALGSSLGKETVAQFVWNAADNKSANELRMEAVLILTELGQNDFTEKLLTQVVSHPSFAGNEVRQAAVWGLGKHGLKSYTEIVPYIADEDENVALHAIAAFGKDTPRPVIRNLVQELLSGDERRTPAASEALRIIASEEAVHELMEAYDNNMTAQNWIIATLGRMPPELIVKELRGHSIMRAIAPMLLFSLDANWLSSEQTATSIDFLLKQNL